MTGCRLSLREHTLTQTIDWHCVWQITRSVLEALYFLSGIGILVAAAYAAMQVRIASDQLKIASEQLRLTKEISDANSRRESVKLAAELCKYYAHEIVPAQEVALKKYVAEKCTFLAPVQQPNPAFIIKNGDFAQVNYDINRITPEWGKVNIEIVMFLNKCESFAIPFAAGVADDAIGFQETAAVFISSVNAFTPAIYYLRQTQGVRYASVLKLWNIWHDRMIAQALAPALKGLQDLIEAAEKNKIRPI
jgi:hypothetical protein